MQGQCCRLLRLHAKGYPCHGARLLRPVVRGRTFGLSWPFSCAAAAQPLTSVQARDSSTAAFGSQAILVDSSHFIYRFHFGFKDRLTAPDGTDTTVVHKFLELALDLVSKVSKGDAGGQGKQRPGRLVFAFDDSPVGGLRSWRKEVYPDYKAKRPKSPSEVADAMAVLPGLLELMGLQTVSAPTAEADDVIATLATLFRCRQHDVLIYSNDKDFKQLIAPGVSLYRSHALEGPEEFAQAYQFAPEHYVDFQALKGDTADNVPGVASIGEKRAAELVREYGSVEAMFERLPEMAPGPAQRALARAGLEHALLMKRLVTLDRQLELPGIDGDGYGAVREPTAQGAEQFKAYCRANSLWKVEQVFDNVMRRVV